MFSLSETPIPNALLRRCMENPEAGACVVFEGWVRDRQDDQTVLSLDYEAYMPLALAEGQAILMDTLRRYKVLEACCMHRVGHLEIGDLAVWVGVSGAHRGEAFQACRYIIDEVKRRVPIWKREHYADGRSVWVNAECGIRNAE